MRERNGEFDCGHIADGEQIPSRFHPPFEHAPKQCLCCRGSVVSRRDSEGYQGWSESPEKQQEPAACGKRRNSRCCPVGDRYCREEAGPTCAVGERKELEERPHLVVPPSQRIRGRVGLCFAKNAHSCPQSSKMNILRRNRSGERRLAQYQRGRSRNSFEPVRLATIRAPL